MSQESNTPPPPVVVFPTLYWLGVHPCVPVTGGYRCVRCATARPTSAQRCEPGMVVHLVDPADVHDDPETFDGLFYAEPEAIAAAHRRWTDDGYRVVRKPTRRSPDPDHPRFRPCPACNEPLMAAGQLGPLTLPATVVAR
jgi:hypothetical protein